MPRPIELPSVDDIYHSLLHIHDAVDWGLIESEWAEEDHSVEVRLQVHEDSDWDVHWGDPQYDQDLRGYWGGASVARDDHEAELRATAQALLDEVKQELGWREP